MSNAQRYRSGNEERVTGLIKAGVKGEIGDLVFLSPTTEYVYPASSIAVDGSGSGSGGGFTGGDAQNDFKIAFLGVLIEGATSGTETVDSPCVVATDGVFEYPLNTALDDAYPPGTPFEAVVSGGFLLDQQIKLSASNTDAFCLLARQGKSGDLNVEVRLFSSVMGNNLS